VIKEFRNAFDHPLSYDNATINPINEQIKNQLAFRDEPSFSRSCSRPGEPVDLSLIPLEYHELSSVFSKDKALTLPPHRPYDCAIDLRPGAPLPSSRLYNLTRPERLSM